MSRLGYIQKCTSKDIGVVQELDHVAVLGVFGTDDIGARDGWAMARQS